jgi:predicted Zn finger-like uncharacterized protein
MKIICDTCGAKYSIADEKVRGKVFKIRCKKCKEIIVVRGTSGAEDAAESAHATAQHAHDMGQQAEDYGYDPATSPVWHVVLDGEQQGPYTAEQVGQFIAAGQLDYEAYCWRDGFADWMHLQDIQELYSVVAAMAQPQAQPQPQQQPAYQDELATAAASGAAMGAYAGTDPYGGMDHQAQNAGYGGGYEQPVAAPVEPQAPVGFTAPASTPAAPASAHEAVSDLFGGSAAPEPSAPESVGSGSVPGAGFTVPSASEEAARGGGHDAGADLFAQPDDGGGFAAEQGGRDVLTSSPRVEVSRMTGTRNENSVLFSLSNLQALASGGGGGPTGASSGLGGSSSMGGASIGAAQGEGSGLIDIRAMAAAAQDERDAAGGVDELLSIGGGGGFAPTLGAPVLMAQPQEKSSKLVFALIGVGAAVVVGIVVLVVVLMMGGEDDDAETVAALDQPSLLAAADSMNPALAATAPGVQPGAAAATNPAAPGAPAVAPAPVPTGEESGEEEEDDSNDDSSGVRRPGGGSKRVGARAPAARGESRGGSSAAARSAEPAAPAKASSSGGTKRGGSGDLDALLDGALGGGGSSGRSKRAAAPAASSGGVSSSSLPDSLTRSQVQGGMNRVAGAVRRCGQGQSGTVMVNVVISGSTGRVTSATVSGQFSGSPVGSCAARAVRGARFPRFRQSSLSVRYPFQVR